MAYDPKKKRPSTKSVDSVVDEIFGAEKSDGKSGKSLKADSSSKASASKIQTSSKKTAPVTRSKSSDSVKKTALKSVPKTTSTGESSKSTKVEESNFKKPELREAIPNNVTPLYSQSEETPLVMQPQVWIATAIAALALLLVVKKRKK